MIKIAFCDDEASVLNDLSKLMDNYQIARNCEISYSVFHSALELMGNLERGLRFDILFMDIVMPGQNGMELAKEIRSLDENVKIIFLTSSAEYAVQSYTVGAYFYQLKPIVRDSFFSIMDKALEACNKARAEKLILKCKTGITAILVEKLEYCEVISRRLVFHMENGKVLESIGTLDELEEKLQAFGGFLRVHRSYLVNMSYIQNVSYRAVTLACLAEIPIPRGKYSEIKKIYLDYVFEKEQVFL